MLDLHRNLLLFRSCTLNLSLGGLHLLFELGILDAVLFYPRSELFKIVLYKLRIFLSVCFLLCCQAFVQVELIDFILVELFPLGRVAL